MFHVLSERGLTAEYEVAYQIGSGTKGRTYAVQVGHYLLESPLSWYAGSVWDVSPGFESLQAGKQYRSPGGDRSSDSASQRGEQRPWFEPCVEHRRLVPRA